MSTPAHERPLRAGRHFLSDGARSVVPVGAHFVPVQGPDWPWRVGPEAFAAAFAQMAALGLDSVRVDVLWAAVEPHEGGYDEQHLAQLDAVLTAAREQGMRLHPALFVGGEVGDAVWDVPWRGERHPHADPQLRRLQAEHAAMLARRWAGEPSILAWDLSDEPPMWLYKDTADADAHAWTEALVTAIRGAGATQPITIGTASQEVDHGPFRADVVASQLDFACVHPYPSYSPELYPDALLATRMTHAGAFETALAAGAGRAVMLHEYGVSSAQFTPARIAAYDRLLAWSSFGRGAIGFFPWCWTDAEPAAYARAPYVRMAHETQFGVVDWQGEVRPRGRVLQELAGTLRALDLDAYAGDGPSVQAAVLVPHEYVRPYDPAAYGLDEAPAGMYVPAETAWTPERDVKPLVRGWLNAFVLAARAGVAVAFPRERLDGGWPDARLLLLPAPLTSTTCSLWHARTSFWQHGQRFLDGGGTLYLSCSADTAIPEMSELAGCRIEDRAPARAHERLRFLLPWGPFAAGDELPLPARSGELHHRGVVLETADARVVAVDAAGAPALVVAERGRGHVVTCALPLELLLADMPDAHGPDDRSWGLYAGLADLAGARDAAGVDHPDMTTGTLTGTRGETLVVTNHAAEPVLVPVRLPADASGLARVGPEGASAQAPDALTLPGHGAALLTYERG